MTVKRYTKHELENLMKDHFNKDLELIPIGNHELRRHQVYQLKMDHTEFVFKYYYQSGYSNREVASLKALEGKFDFIPKLVDYGKLDGDREWILMNKLEGIPFFKIQKHLNAKIIQKIYYDMGVYLKDLHKLKFDFYGDWNEEMIPLSKKITLEAAFWDRASRVVGLIETRELPNKPLLEEALAYLKKYSSSVLKDSQAVFTHNDYNSRNIMIKQTSEDKWVISGVLDFEQSMPFEREFDFVHLKLFDFLHFSHSEDYFFEGYESKNINQELLNYFILYQSLKIATWAFDQSKEYYDIAISEIKKKLGAL